MVTLYLIEDNNFSQVICIMINIYMTYKGQHIASNKLSSVWYETTKKET